MKPKKEEIVVSVVLLASLVGYLAFQGMQTSQPYSMAPVGLPTSAFEPSAYSETSGGDSGEESGPSAGGSLSPPPIEKDRVKDIRQSVVGCLERGSFEPTVSAMHESVESYGGYVYTETLTYSEESWIGELVTRIPQDSATDFVFDIRKLIEDNGKVESITTSITDITGQIQEGESAPHASIKVALSEVYEKPQPSRMPIIDQALPMLISIFTLLGVATIIGLPSFFALLGIAILMRRGLYPLIIRFFKKAES